MKLAIVGSSPFSYVIQRYLDRVKGVPASVIGRTPKGALRFFFWAANEDEKEIIQNGLQRAEIPFEEIPFPSAALYQGALVEERSDDLDQAFFQKTNTDIQFIGANVVNFFVTTPEDPSEWVLGETDTVKKIDTGWQVNLLGIDMDVEQLAATIPLPILASMMGKHIRAARMFIYRSLVLEGELPFDENVPYSVVWDVDNEGVYRWVRHIGNWYKEEFSFRRVEGKNGHTHIRYPLRLTEFEGAKLYGPFAQWDPRAGLAHVLERLDKEF